MINDHSIKTLIYHYQDPKMEVLYHIWPYFVGIFPYIGLKSRPYIWYVPHGTSIQSAPEMAIDIMMNQWLSMVTPW